MENSFYVKTFFINLVVVYIFEKTPSELGGGNRTPLKILMPDDGDDFSMGIRKTHLNNFPQKFFVAVDSLQFRNLIGLLQQIRASLFLLESGSSILLHHIGTTFLIFF